VLQLVFQVQLTSNQIPNCNTTKHEKNHESIGSHCKSTGCEVAPYKTTPPSLSEANDHFLLRESWAGRRQSGYSKANDHFLQPAKLMEVLIPFIYNAIKERNIRSYSRCSSTGSASGFSDIGVEDGVWEQKQW
jgi:methionyl-tRNA synthetase